MLTLTDIVRRYGASYQAQAGSRLLPSHRRALDAIATCRTAARGGHMLTCQSCKTVTYRYHSCKNRHCPACQHSDTQRWLEQHTHLLLPVPTFLVTFTLPEPLRELARSHQRFFYRLLFQTSARALQELAAEPRFLGGRIGLLGVLQTWTRDLRFHPHVHYLVPAIGVQPDGTICRPRNPAFLVPVLALGQRFRTLFRRALVRSPFAAQLPRTLWTSSWVVDCRAVGSGEAALRYLAPYIFRVALSNRRLVRLHNGRVTFAYRDGRTKQMRTTTLEAHAFLARFLQHVLPRGFVKVRCYGLFSKTARALLERVRLYLLMTAPAKREAPSPAQTASPAPTDALRCVRCGGLLEVTLVQPVRSRGPPEWKKDDTNSILTATHMGRTASCASLMRPADCMRGLWKQARAVRTIPVNWLQPRRCHSLEE